MGREMEDGPEEPGKEHLVFMYRICDVRSLLPRPTLLRRSCHRQRLELVILRLTSRLMYRSCGRGRW